MFSCGKICKRKSPFNPKIEKNINDVRTQKNCSVREVERLFLPIKSMICPAHWSNKENLFRKMQNRPLSAPQKCLKVKRATFTKLKQIKLKQINKKLNLEKPKTTP